MMAIPIISVPVYLGTSFKFVLPPGVTKLEGLVVTRGVPISGETEYCLKVRFMYLL